MFYSCCGIKKIEEPCQTEQDWENVRRKATYDLAIRSIGIAFASLGVVASVGMGMYILIQDPFKFGIDQSMGIGMGIHFGGVLCSAPIIWILGHSIHSIKKYRNQKQINVLLHKLKESKSYADLADLFKAHITEFGHLKLEMDELNCYGLLEQDAKEALKEKMQTYQTLKSNFEKEKQGFEGIKKEGEAYPTFMQGVEKAEAALSEFNATFKTFQTSFQTGIAHYWES